MKPETTARCLLALCMILAGETAGRAQEPKAADDPAARASRKAVDLLVEQFRKHPAKPSDKPGQVGLYLIDARGGEATRIACEPEPGLNQSASPVWSHDGRRILFDATPGEVDFRLTRIKAIALDDDGHLATTDLGPGNCPEFAPDDEKVMFLLNDGAIPGAAAGVWIMKADGSERTRLESYGRPRWSPDNSRIMVIGFGKPVSVTLIDVRPDRKSGDLQLDGHTIFSPPRWAGEGTIVASIGDGEAADSIALIDVTDPGRCEVKEVLWKRGGGPDVIPMTSNFSTATGRCVFVARDGEKGLALYGFDRGKPGPPTRLELGGFDLLIQDPVFSPDGRYLVFSSNRPEGRKPVDPPAR